MKKHNFHQPALLCMMIFLGLGISIVSASAKTFNPKGDVHGAWIATVSNLNWPSKPALSVQQQKQEAIAILDKAQEAGFNMIIFQVRPAGDAFYKSDYFPWSHCLSGTQGKAPGYDPLAFWVEQSHKRGMALHAWVNPYRLSTRGGGDTPDLSIFSKDHPAHKHKDWVVSYADNKMYFNPGIPECREYVVNAALEIVKKYDVDGLHMDDYFYPYPASKKDENGNNVTVPFPDDEAFKQFSAGFLKEAGLENASENEQRDAWRRRNVDLMIKEIHSGMKAVNPELQFGVSPFGIWRNKTNDPAGSDTRGLQSYDALHADTKYWVEAGIIDYIVPQLYWNIGFEVADYAKLLPWWSEVVSKSPGVKLYIGMAAHRVGGKEGTPWEGSAEIVRQLKMNQANPAVSGEFLFGWKSIADNRAGLTDELKTLFGKEGSATQEISPYYFKPGTVSVYLNPSLQPKNIGFGDYGTEEDRMHELSAYVEKVLLDHGVTVYQNRIGMTLDESIADSNSKKPTIHLAIHSNAFRKQTRGVETFYKAKDDPAKEECIRLATRVYEGLLKIYDGPRRGIKETETLREPRTVVAPSTLVEVAFHDNEVDSKWILENMQQIGENLAASLLLHLAEEHPEAVKP